MKSDATTGHEKPRRFALAASRQLARSVNEFWGSGEAERFVRAGENGRVLEYLLRRPGGIAVYSKHLGIEHGSDCPSSTGDARELVSSQSRNLRRGFTYTYILLAAG